MHDKKQNLSSFILFTESIIIFIIQRLKFTKEIELQYYK